MDEEKEMEKDEPTADIINLIKDLNVARIGSPRTPAFPFTSKFTSKLLHNCHVLYIGDSLIRALYKDMVKLLQTDELLSPWDLRGKNELSCNGDRQIDILPLEKDRVFRQAREYQDDFHLLQFQFTTRMMKGDIEKMFSRALVDSQLPDIVIFNSVLWDVSRYQQVLTGENHLSEHEQSPESLLAERNNTEEFLERFGMFCRRLRAVLKPDTLVIFVCQPWPQTPDERNRGFQSRPGVQTFLRSIYCDAQFRASQMARSFGFDVLDIGFYMRNHTFFQFRTMDGIHWDQLATRFMNQLLIGHICRSFDIPLPESFATTVNNWESHRENRPLLLKSAAAVLKSFDRNTRTIGDDTDRGIYYQRLQHALATDIVKRFGSDSENAMSKVLSMLTIMRTASVIINNPTLACSFQQEDIDRFMNELKNDSSFVIFGGPDITFNVKLRVNRKRRIGEARPIGPSSVQNSSRRPLREEQNEGGSRHERNEDQNRRSSRRNKK